MPVTAKDKKIAPLLTVAIGDAMVGYRHAETIVQARFNNYLVAASILLASWAAFPTSDPWSDFLRGAVAMLGLVCSVLWAILGSRQRKFLTLHMDMLVHLENQLPEDAKQMGVMTNVPLHELQRGHPVALRMVDQKVQLTWAEQHLQSRNLLVWVPLLFALTFVVLFTRTLALFLHCHL